jgi:hypothetical protein
MFTLTAKFADTIALVNGIPPSKLPLLLTRIINSIEVEVQWGFDSPALGCVSSCFVDGSCPAQGSVHRGRGNATESAVFVGQ